VGEVVAAQGEQAGGAREEAVALLVSVEVEQLGGVEAQQGAFPLELAGDGVEAREGVAQARLLLGAPQRPEGGGRGGAREAARAEGREAAAHGGQGARVAHAERALLEGGGGVEALEARGVPAAQVRRERPVHALGGERGARAQP